MGEEIPKKTSGSGQTRRNDMVNACPPQKGH
jgi:hypothetical protein